jgi:hypothetical protein
VSSVFQPRPERRDAAEHLGIADRHLSEAADRLAFQEESVSRLPPGTRGRAVADELLTTMRKSFALMRAHREIVLRELGEDDPTAWSGFS